MEINDLFGLPAHPLIVHAVVVLVPLAAVGAAVCALWPAARDRVGWLVAGVAVAGCVLVPLATGSGEALEERVRESELVERHADLAEQLLPWMIFLAIAIVAVMVVAHLRRTGTGARVLRGILVALTLVASTGTIVATARIGHSGARATWHDVRPAGEGAEPGDDD